MAIMRVNPTRMELTRLKKRLEVATRGHKLLKDKRDELMKRFIDLVKRNKELRERVEGELVEAFGNFMMARAVMSSEVMEEALMYPTQRMDLKLSKRNIMGVDVPRIKFTQAKEEGVSPYPYGFVNTSGELDGAIKTLSDILPRMIELAEIEKSCQLMAEEIEKTRRRVNALEYVMIPQLTETIRFIKMKLDENERANLTRLMKVKDMLEEREG